MSKGSSVGCEWPPLLARCVAEVQREMRGYDNRLVPAALGLNSSVAQGTEKVAISTLGNTRNEGGPDWRQSIEIDVSKHWTLQLRTLEILMSDLIFSKFRISLRIKVVIAGQPLTSLHRKISSCVQYGPLNFTHVACFPSRSFVARRKIGLSITTNFTDHMPWPEANGRVPLSTS